MAKQYIAPEALTVAFNTETRFAITLSEWETGASGMQSIHRYEVEEWDELDEFDDED